jgi:hypothetical protein
MAAFLSRPARNDNASVHEFLFNAARPWSQRARLSLVFVIAVAAGGPGVARAQSSASSAEPRWRASVATDATPWFLKGYSGIIAVETQTFPKWRATVELWSMRLPTAVTNLAGDNEGAHFTHDVRWATALYVDRFVGTGGWHVGGALNWMRSEIERQASHGDLSVVEVLARIGFRYLPFGPRGPFFNPWFAAGPQFPTGPLPELDGRKYALSPVQVLGTLHIGWRY